MSLSLDQPFRRHGATTLVRTRVERHSLLDLFHEHDREDVTVLADVVLPELGSFFFRKYNRNIIISVASPEGFASERFRWIPLTTMIELFQHDHVINNDARLVFGLLIKTMVQSQLAVHSNQRDELLSALKRTAKPLER